MTSDEKMKRFEELQILEEDLKNKRDFLGLISIHNESMSLFSSTGNKAERIPKKAYCYARLNMKREAEETLQSLGKYANYLGSDELYRILTLINIFISEKATELGSMQIVTIKNWLQDAKISKEISEIIFDSRDYLK